MASNAAPLAIDWRAVAEFRLDRLVEAEHDVSLMRERIERLLAEHGEWLVAEEARFELRWAARERALLRSPRIECPSLREGDEEGAWQHAEGTSQLEEIARLRAALIESEAAARLASEKNAELLASTSWRITAPLRAAVIALRARRTIIRQLLLALLRVPGLRLLARQLLRPFPKLRSRVVTIIVTDA